MTWLSTCDVVAKFEALIYGAPKYLAILWSVGLWSYLLVLIAA